MTPTSGSDALMTCVKNTEPLPIAETCNTWPPACNSEIGANARMILLSIRGKRLAPVAQAGSTKPRPVASCSHETIQAKLNWFRICLFVTLNPALKAYHPKMNRPSFPMSEPAMSPWARFARASGADVSSKTRRPSKVCQSFRGCVGGVTLAVPTTTCMREMYVRFFL